MSKKDDRIAELSGQRDVLVSMVLRASREVPELRLRAGIVEDLLKVAPAAALLLRDDEQPQSIRLRARPKTVDEP